MKDDGSQKNFPTWQMSMAENQSTWNFTFVNKFHFTSHTETLFVSWTTYETAGRKKMKHYI